ncbi:ATP-binding protein [Thiomonas delicata]|uniref:histidine kinase n=1 Tax=Thiomonas delicata TaxID=364030 RepID=A0A238D2Y9_THIDL
MPGGQIEVRLHRLDKAVELAVLDQGPGIPAVQRDELIRPFIRVDLSASSGLGLAIVDRIARLHGGHPTLLERKGGGLTATTHLPFTQQDEDIGLILADDQDP